jgi:four helix bundle protein
MKTHRDLHVWHRSIDYVTAIYDATNTYPKHELYVLASQLRRAAISVPANISEGAARSHIGEYRQFIYIAIASLSEIETHLIISKNLNYLSEAQFQALIAERDIIAKMLVKLKQSL